MKNILESLSNWEIIKLLGGISIIIPTLVSGIIIFVREIFFNKWKHKHEKAIIKLKSVLDTKSNILDTVQSSLSSINLKVIPERTKCLCSLWEIMMDTKRLVPTCIMHANQILTADEYESILSENGDIKDDDLVKEIRSVDTHDFILKLAINSRKVENMRPLLNNDLWNVYFSYQAFLGRIVALATESMFSGKSRHWTNDKYIFSVIEQVIPKNDLQDIIDNNSIYATRTMMNYFENYTLNLISKILSGKSVMNDILLEAEKNAKIKI